MTTEEHRERHRQLHESLDELFADYIRHHPEQHKFLQMPLDDLLTWSAKETQNPSEETD